jgi:hypothetical protein
MRRLHPMNAAAGLVLLTGCVFNGPSPSASFCDGIPADWGACDTDRPSFSGATCGEVGTEFGQQLGPRALEIFDGPQIVDGNDRTVQLQQLVILHIQLANKHLRDTGQVMVCEVPEFLDAAEAAFPAEFIERVGSNAFFDQTVSYEAWREDLKRFLVVIDRDESEPYAPSPSDDAPATSP